MGTTDPDLSACFFSSLVVSGYKKSLTRQDLWNLNPEDRCQSVVPKLEIEWNKEVLKSQRFVPCSS